MRDNKSSRQRGKAVGRKWVAWLSIVSFVFQTVFAPVVMAQSRVIVDPNAPIVFQPRVGASSNGTTTIDITRPSSGGISHNKFREYNIDASGVILNNSTTAGQSIIGGHVGANPNLTGGPTATTILNEVTGSIPSSIAGPTEVFGARANVIIANPNGVGCVGCTFINTRAITLTTGVPVPDYNAGTVRYDIRGGTVSVHGDGLSAAAGQTLSDANLFGRNVHIEAPVITTDQVNVVGATGVFDPATNNVTANGVAGLSSSDVSVRSTTAGVIRAGRVSVLSTDLDVGVELFGSLQSLDESLIVRSAGDLSMGSGEALVDIDIQAAGTLAIDGHQQAGQQLNLQAHNIDIAGNRQISGLAGITVVTTEDLTSAALFNTGGSITVEAGGSVSLSESLFLSPGTISVDANGDIFTQTFGFFGNRVTLAASGLAELNGTLAGSQTDIDVTGRDITLGEGTAFDAVGTIMLSADRTFTNATTLNFLIQQNLVVNFGTGLVNTATGVVIDRVFDRQFSATVQNAGLLFAEDELRISAGQFEQQASGMTFAPEITLDVAGTATNAGVILADNRITISAERFSNSESVSSHDVTITASATSGTGITNSGEIRSENSQLLISRNSQTSNSGLLRSEEAIDVEAGAFENTTTGVAVANVVTLDIANAGNNAGAILGDVSVSITAGTFANSQDITSLNVAISTLDNLTNSGDIEAANNLQFTSQNGTAQNSGLLSAGEIVNITTRHFENLADGVVVAPTVGISAVSLANAGEIAGVNTTLSQRNASDPAGAFENSGTITVVNTLQINGATRTFSNSGTLDVERLITASVQSFQNTNTGQILAPGILLDSATFANAGNIAGDAVEVSATGASGLSNSGTLVGLTILSLNATNGVFDNSGIVGSSDRLFINTLNFQNSGSGEILAPGLFITADQFNNAASIGGDTISVEITGTQTATNSGTISATQLLDISLASAGLVNSGLLKTDAEAFIDALTLHNTTSGEITGPELFISATGTASGQRFVTNNGKIIASDYVEVRAGDVANTGSASQTAEIRGGTVVIIANNALTNGAFGLINGTSAVSLQASTTPSRNTLLASRTLSTGLVQTGGDLFIVIENDTLVMPGYLNVPGNFALQQHGTINNAGGTLKATGNLALKSTAGSILNTEANGTGALIEANGDLSLEAAGDIRNVSSTIRGLGNVQIIADGVIVNTRTVLPSSGANSNETPRQFLSRFFSSIDAFDVLNLPSLGIYRNIFYGLGNPLAFDNELSYSNFVNESLSRLDNVTNASVSLGGVGEVLPNGRVRDSVQTCSEFCRTADHIIISPEFADFLIARLDAFKANEDATFETGGEGGALISAGQDLFIEAQSFENNVSTVSSGQDINIISGTLLNESATTTVQDIGFSLGRTEIIDSRSPAEIISSHGVSRIVHFEVDSLDVGDSGEGQRTVPSNVSANGDIRAQVSGTFTNTGTFNAQNISVSAATVINEPPPNATTLTPRTRPAPLVVPLIPADAAENAATAPATPESFTSVQNKISEDLLAASDAANGVGAPTAPAFSATLEAIQNAANALGDLINVNNEQPDLPDGPPDPEPDNQQGRADALRNDANQDIEFLVDPVREQQLIREAIVRETGRNLLDTSFESEAEQYEALHNARIAYLAANPDIQLGDRLTNEQRRGITTPLIWYERQTINGRDVLVPQLILPPSVGGENALPAGTINALNSLEINADTVNNAALLLSGGTVRIDAGTLRNERRHTLTERYGYSLRELLDIVPVIAGADVEIETDGDLVNYGGTITASERLRLAALTGDVVNEAAEEDFITVFRKKGGLLRKSKTTIDKGTRYEPGQFLSGGTIEIIAYSGTVGNIGSEIAASEGISIVARDLVEQDLKANTFQDNGLVKCNLFGCKGSQKQRTETIRSSIVSDTGDISVSVTDGDFVSRGSTLQALEGRIDVSAENVRFETAAFEEINRRYDSSVGITGFSSSRTDYNDFTVEASVVLGEAIDIRATGDVTGIGAELAAGEGGLHIEAGGDIDFDRLQLAYFSETKGFSVGLSFPGSNLIDAATSGGGAQAVLDAYVDSVPLLGAVRGLKNAKGGVGTAITGLSLAARASDTIAQINAPVSDGGGIENVLNPFAGNFEANGDFSPSLTITFTSFTSSDYWDESLTSSLSSEGDVTLVSGQDIALVGGTALTALGNASLDAGGSLTIAAADDSYASRSSSTSFGITITPQGIGGASFSKSKSKSSGTTHTPGSITAEGNVTLKAGRDVVIDGSQVAAGGTVDVEAGEDLTIASRQNTSQSSSSSVGISVNPGGGSISVGRSRANRQFTDDQAGIVGTGDVNVKVEEHTQLDAGVIASTDGEVNVDTGTLGFSNNQDRDRSTSFGVTVGTGNKITGGTVEGDFAYRRVEGNSNATIDGSDGETITIRDKEKQAELEASGQTQNVAALNRDLDRAQEITKNEEQAGSFYASERTVENAAKAIEAVAEEVSNAIKSTLDTLLENAAENKDAEAIKRQRDQGLISDQEALVQLMKVGVYSPAQLEAYLLLDGTNASAEEIDALVNQPEYRVRRDALQSAIDKLEDAEHQDLTPEQKNTLAQDVLQATGRLANYIADLNPVQQELALFSLKLATGGPIKAVVAQAAAVVVGEVFGEDIAALHAALADEIVVKSGGPSGSSNADPESPLGLQHAGARLAVSVLLGIGAKVGGNIARAPDGRGSGGGGTPNRGGANSGLTYRIGNSDGGPGAWTRAKESLKPDQLAYQRKVTGAPKGTVYNVPDANVPSGRTSFDGYNPKTNTLIDAKCWVCWPRNDKSWSNASVVNQAHRQQRIAQQTGRTVEWHVPDQAAATRVQNAFATATTAKKIDPNVVRIVITPQ